MKRALALLLAVMLIVSLTACQTGTTGPTEAPSTPSPEPQEVQNAADDIIGNKEYSKVYKTSFSSSYSSFNYFSTAYSTVRSIVSNCIDGLVEPDIYGVYVPSIAESWKANEDQTVWTFKIRQGVNWVDHEGKDRSCSNCRGFRRWHPLYRRSAKRRLFSARGTQSHRRPV